VLPNRYPSRVVALQVWYHASHQQQQQQQQAQELQQSVNNPLLLYVLNARGQLICWKLPEKGITACSMGTQIAGSSQIFSRAVPGVASSAVPPAGSRALVNTVPAPLAAAAGVSLSTSWPLAVCSLERPSRVAAAAAAAAAPGTSGAGKPRGHAATTAAAGSEYTCLLIPTFGSRCVLAGSSSGFIIIAALQHALPGSSGANSSNRSRSSSSEHSATACSAPRASTSRITAATAGYPQAAAAGTAPEGHAAAGTASASTASPGCHVTVQQQQRSHGDGGASSSNSNSSHICCCLLPSHQRTLLIAEGACSSACGSAQLNLECVACNALHKLALHLTKRYCAQSSMRNFLEGRSSSDTGIGVGGGTGTALLAAESQVLCMTASASGQVIVGLGSGQVCVLKFKRRTGRMSAATVEAVVAVPAESAAATESGDQACHPAC